MKKPESYPMAVFDVNGKSKLVTTAEDRDALDPLAWRDSPAAFEKNPGFAAYTEQNLPDPAQVALETENAQLRKELDALKAKR